MIINDLDGYYIVFDTKNWNTELDTLLINSLYRIKSSVWWKESALLEKLFFIVLIYRGFLSPLSSYRLWNISSREICYGMER